MAPPLGMKCIPTSLVPGLGAWKVFSRFRSSSFTGTKLFSSSFAQSHGPCTGPTRSSGTGVTSPTASFASYTETGVGSSHPWRIELVPCLKDNYAYLIVDQKTRVAAVVDPSECAPVAEAAARLEVKLEYVMCTHHHWDHTGGNLDLKSKFNAQIVGPAADKDRIPGIDIALSDGQVWKLGDLQVHVIHTPGHTTGHCSFYLPQIEAVFTGDTLFSLGCGRLFEGTPSQMWTSLSRLAALPPSSRVFCGHEYTASNAKFALSVEPNNVALQERAQDIQHLRSQGLPTIPTTLGQELATNPFLRPQSGEIRASVGLGESASDMDVFAAVRKAKDSF